MTDPARQRDPWVRAYIGRDFLRRRGWALHFIFLPCRSLMRADEEGFLVLAAFALSVGFVPPRGFWWAVKSDVNEIATRRAAP